MKCLNETHRYSYSYFNLYAGVVIMYEGLIDYSTAF